MQSNRITLVTLSAHDVPTLAAFYKALGWVASAEMPATVFFDMDGMKLGIYDRTMLAADLGRKAGALGVGAVTLAQNFPGRAAVDDAFAQAVAAGATICKAPEEVFWGGYSGTWADPEGHVWEYAWNPDWPLDAAGHLA